MKKNCKRTVFKKIEKVRYFSWITQFSVSRAYMRWEVAEKSFNVIASLLEKSLSTIFHKHENVGYNACADQLHSIRLYSCYNKVFFMFLYLSLGSCNECLLLGIAHASADSQKNIKREIRVY